MEFFVVVPPLFETDNLSFIYIICAFCHYSQLFQVVFVYIVRSKLQSLNLKNQPELGSFPDVSFSELYNLVSGARYVSDDPFIAEFDQSFANRSFAYTKLLGKDAFLEEFLH
ncbi:hypothetical protein AU468_05175 [Alkalispirochaeta sphaeroplastigenens]|uniref:Uncharacterized protein n=1 Tax=Alkalispirochaeta sphaeroplastigenens TaxID=1187066 RepID=A0A2S4JVK1_9SPIO|nr:hypothetical protein AU468_05175 [Alkalispirochaeta sphaeroplastigenens]